MKKPNADALQERVQAILDAAVATGNAIGCQAAAYVDGELVLNAYAGWLDKSRSRRVDDHSLFAVYSTGKGIASTAFLRLVERGLLGLDQAVGEIWPEFACNGKEATTIRHILQHRSGVCIRTPYDSIPQIADWEEMCRRVAAVKPVFPPGSATRYQTINYSWLLCEPARRMTGKPFQQIVTEEVFQPAGMTNMFFGVPDEALPRVATVYRGADMPPIPTPTPCWDYSLEEIMNTRVIQQACLPGFNCITNAIDLAKHYSRLLDCTSNGRLLSKEMIREACVMSLAPNDPPPASRASWGTHGLGYAVSDPDENNVARHFGHGGYGGPDGGAWQPGRVAFGLTGNLMGPTGKLRGDVISAIKQACTQ
ncbi:MAG: serine hydrolase domain-containing protein [Lentisphaeria bacterium]|jgi:CubicO group peptidase (beta-lactamase class C family)